MPSNYFRSRSYIEFSLDYDNDHLVSFIDGSQTRLIRNLKCTVYGYWQTANITAVIVSRLLGQWEAEHVGYIDLHASSNDRDLIGYSGDEEFTAWSASHAGTFVDRPQIALVIDGVWQEDPMQAPGSHNFNFSWNY